MSKVKTDICIYKFKYYDITFPREGSRSGKTRHLTVRIKGYFIGAAITDTAIDKTSNIHYFTIMTFFFQERKASP